MSVLCWIFMAATVGFAIAAGLAETVWDVARYGGAAVICVIFVVVILHMEDAR
jgi:uncharacterized membrane protein YkvI